MYSIAVNTDDFVLFLVQLNLALLERAIRGGGFFSFGADLGVIGVAAALDDDLGVRGVFGVFGVLGDLGVFGVFGVGGDLGVSDDRGVLKLFRCSRRSAGDAPCWTAEGRCMYTGGFGSAHPSTSSSSHLYANVERSPTVLRFGTMGGFMRSTWSISQLVLPTQASL